MSDLMIWYPIGTLDEIDTLGLPRNITASCSMQTADNRGCAYYSKCRFRQIRDGAQPRGHQEPLKGPENVAVYVQLSPGQGGAADIIFTSCENYYTSGLHARWRHMVENDGSGEIVKLLGIAGDIDPLTGKEKTYIRKEQVKMHLKKDPDCPDCATNTCIRMKSIKGADGKSVRKPIPHFPRPNESLADIAIGAEIGDEIRAEVMAEMEREALNLDVHVEEPDERDEAGEPEPVGAKSRGK